MEAVEADSCWLVVAINHIDECGLKFYKELFVNDLFAARDVKQIKLAHRTKLLSDYCWRKIETKQNKIKITTWTEFVAQEEVSVKLQILQKTHYQEQTTTTMCVCVF